MSILYHKVLVFLITHGHIIWIIYILSLEFFKVCCMLSVSKNNYCNCTWFFRPHWLLLFTATYYWYFIQTHKQQLQFYLISLFPNSQVYDITLFLSRSWSYKFFIMFILHSYRERTLLKFPYLQMWIFNSCRGG